MTKETAIAINKHVIAWAMFHNGITPDEPEPIIYSLRQMLEASDKIHQLNAAASLKGGHVTRYLTVDDRLIAALYVAANYEHNQQSIIQHGRKYIFVQE
ncbi:hypothetical protein [Parapedobacter soli]|uniref:hypothetical protein n=1 Tax=Parapedobacter soli TaxID=416955 RepID=UPI0021C5EDB8|nr:hypothetical protein [Parapedobacter soli]